GVENVLHTGLAPDESFQVGVGTVSRRMMIREIAECRLVRSVEPAFHACQVPVPGCGWQIVGQAPDAQEHRKHMCPRIRKREFYGLRSRRHRTVEHSGIEIEK